MKEVDLDLVSDKWYRVPRASGVVYTPFKVNKTVFFTEEHGGIPTPREIVETLNKYKNSMYLGDGFYEREEEDDSDEEHTLSPGIYRHVPANTGREGLVPFNLRTDEYIPLGSAFEEVKKDINNFLQAEDYYNEVGTMYKLGILLYGPPGGGKSTLIREVLKKTEEDAEAYVIYVTDGIPSLEFFECVKRSLADKLKIFVFEELTTNMSDYRFVEKMLNFLDGEVSVPKSITLATTNYPENLPGNLVDRPSRFDKLIKFDNPGDEDRTKILNHYLGRAPESQEVKDTKDLSIAQIKEIVSSMRIDKKTFTQALKDMLDRKQKVKKAFAEVKSKVGFGYD